MENLGFIINYSKSLLIPTQEIDFLGFTMNSVTMESNLLGGKMRPETKTLQEIEEPRALTLSRLLGKLNLATKAIPPVPFFTGTYSYVSR